MDEKQTSLWATGLNNAAPADADHQVRETFDQRMRWCAHLSFWLAYCFVWAAQIILKLYNIKFQNVNFKEDADLQKINACQLRIQRLNTGLTAGRKSDQMILLQRHPPHGNHLCLSRIRLRCGRTCRRFGHLRWSVGGWLHGGSHVKSIDDRKRLGCLWLWRRGCQSRPSAMVTKAAKQGSGGSVVGVCADQSGRAGGKIYYFRTTWTCLVFNTNRKICASIWIEWYQRPLGDLCVETAPVCNKCLPFIWKTRGFWSGKNTTSAMCSLKKLIMLCPESSSSGYWVTAALSRTPGLHV